MPRPKQTMMPPRFDPGAKVRVKRGVSDPDFPDIPLGGWAGTIEIGNQKWQGFVVRALGEGGEVIEVEQCRSLGEALVALESEIPKAKS